MTTTKMMRLRGRARRHRRLVALDNLAAPNSEKTKAILEERGS